MTELSTVSIFLIDKFKSQPLVNTITFEKTGEIDTNKNNIYPLVNIDIVDSDPIGNILTFNYNITILQQRDIDNEINNDKILDTHGGSGSSRIAACKANLPFMGFELDEDYFKASVKRFEQYVSQTRLF